MLGEYSFGVKLRGSWYIYLFIGIVMQSLPNNN